MFGGRLNQRFDTNAGLIFGQCCCEKFCQGYCIECLAGIQANVLMCAKLTGMLDTVSV